MVHRTLFIRQQTIVKIGRSLRVEHDVAAAEGRDRKGRFRTEANQAAARRSREATRLSIDNVMDVSIVDPARDEELFVLALRKLIGSLTPARRRRTPPTKSVTLKGRSSNPPR
jgi:hypothetical protein